jgi:hypothetical protein
MVSGSRSKRDDDPRPRSHRRRTQRAARGRPGSTADVPRSTPVSVRTKWALQERWPVAPSSERSVRDSRVGVSSSSSATSISSREGSYAKSNTTAQLRSRPGTKRRAHSRFPVPRSRATAIPSAVVRPLSCGTNLLPVRYATQRPPSPRGRMRARTARRRFCGSPGNPSSDVINVQGPDEIRRRARRGVA